MPRLSINELTTYRWSFEEDVLSYAQAGVSSIGVWRQKLADFGEEKGAELLADSGLAVSNLLWAGGFTGSDGRTFQESLEDAEEAVRLARELQAGCLVVYSGTRNGHTHRHARRLVRTALGELVPMAELLQVKLAVAPMHVACADGWTFLTDIKETLDLVTEFDSPAVGLAFDTYHLGQDPRIVELLPELVSRIAIVHLGDAKAPPTREQNRCRLGEGTLPLGPIVQTLCDAGYEGFFDVLLMGEDIETHDYEVLLRHSQGAFHELIAS